MVFFPWEEAADVFWVFSLGVSFCAAAAAAGAAVEDLEACVGFEVELEGCRRRLPSSPAEDEWRLLLPPSSPIGGCRHKGQSRYMIDSCFHLVRETCRSFLDTHHHPEVLQVLELGEVFLQLWVDVLVLYLRVFQEGPELLQSVQLTWRSRNSTEDNSFKIKIINKTRLWRFNSGLTREHRTSSNHDDLLVKAP